MTLSHFKCDIIAYIKHEKATFMNAIMCVHTNPIIIIVRRHCLCCVSRVSAGRLYKRHQHINTFADGGDGVSMFSERQPYVVLNAHNCLCARARQSDAFIFAVVIVVASTTQHDVWFRLVMGAPVYIIIDANVHFN